MLFSSILFLIYFFPLSVFLYFIFPANLRNFLLLLLSLFFYFWDGGTLLLILVLSILFNWLIGRILGRSLSELKSRKYLLIAGIVGNLALLIYFKYLIFFLQQFKFFKLNLDVSLLSDKIYMPLGISFFTFQGISYLYDVYSKKINYEKNLINYALVISFFPHVIAGPIVRYADINEELIYRSTCIQNIVRGFERFILGLGKKVILADTLAVAVDRLFLGEVSTMNSLTLCIGIISYSAQIYFDFSGYSDMAIGLAKVFGFHFPENFNSPYKSSSVSEFWQRWHMSLSKWFRDYVYIPLGGNRRSNLITLRNLFIVFILCGFWHGAEWKFLVWGLYHGCFLSVEKAFLSRTLNRLPKVLSHTYLLITISVGWIFFRSPNLSHASEFIQALFTFKDYSIGGATFFDLRHQIILAVSILCLFSSKPNLKFVASESYFWQRILNPILLTVILIVSLAFLSTRSYSPFIYFQF